MNENVTGELPNEALPEVVIPTVLCVGSPVPPLNILNTSAEIASFLREKYPFAIAVKAVDVLSPDVTPPANLALPSAFN